MLLLRRGQHSPAAAAWLHAALPARRSALAAVPTCQELQLRWKVLQQQMWKPMQAAHALRYVPELRAEQVGWAKLTATWAFSLPH